MTAFSRLARRAMRGYSCFSPALVFRGARWASPPSPRRQKAPVAAMFVAAPVVRAGLAGRFIPLQPTAHRLPRHAQDVCGLLAALSTRHNQRHGAAPDDRACFVPDGPEIFLLHAT